jgi:NAD+ synthase
METLQNCLHLDAVQTIERLRRRIFHHVRTVLRKKGAVVAISGGIDSSVCAALCVHALGKENVLAVSLPERDSSGESLKYGKLLAESLGIAFFIEDITATLAAAGCYAHQREAIRTLFPDYGEDWKHKITLPSILGGERLNVSSLTVQSPAGQTQSARMPLPVYLQLVAATNMKQRTRKMFEYSLADRYNYAVCGTPNRLEYDQGFFVKQGDGSADFKPIAHLYKSQVYQLAGTLNIPEEIRRRTPTTDTYSLPQTQEEFYFSVPYQQMDYCLFGHNHSIPAQEIAPVAGLSAEQVQRIYTDIDHKRRATIPLHLPPLTIEDISEIRALENAAIQLSRNA